MPSSEARPQSPLRILVVDDDVLIQMATSDMVLDLGHEVLEVGSGGGALELLRGGEKIDLVITDQAMPGMSGLELAREIRSFLPDMPILLASGYGDLPDNHLDLPLLGKPFRMEDLAAKIDLVLGGPRAEAQ
ncbi:MAG TPA: response regulator [Saliniramus sp.]|nr:response regulator [Saliniramus sp.]